RVLTCVCQTGGCQFATRKTRYCCDEPASGAATGWPGFLVSAVVPSNDEVSKVASGPAAADCGLACEPVVDGFVTTGVGCNSQWRSAAAINAAQRGSSSQYRAEAVATIHPFAHPKSKIVINTSASAGQGRIAAAELELAAFDVPGEA